MRTSQRKRILSNITRAAALLLTTVFAGACATRSPVALAPSAAVAAGIIWRIEEGDIVKTRVSGSPDLGTEATVSSSGSAFFPSLGRVNILGLSLDSLEALLNTRYSTQVVRNAAVQVTMQREITLQGQIRGPGVYAVEPGQSVTSLIARAGGPNTATSTPRITLETTGGRQLTMPREARLGSIEIHRRDAIVVADESFLARNATAITSASLAVSLLSAVVGILAFATR